MWIGMYRKADERSPYHCIDISAIVPMATLLSASQPPSSTKSEGSQPAILSPEGKKRYFIVHGGLFSKDGVTLDDVKKIDRYGKQPGQEGLMCELLWTDPQDAPGRGPSKRGVGVGFGPDVTKRWCEANQVTAVIRSHEVRQNGYAIEHGESHAIGLRVVIGHGTGAQTVHSTLHRWTMHHDVLLPQLLRLYRQQGECPGHTRTSFRLGTDPAAIMFSVSQAAYVRMQDDGQLSYHQFDAVPHPDIRPMAYSGGFQGMGM